MRIIAGRNRGRKLFWKSDASTRPTKDRVRESVFDVLAGKIDLNGARVLDLFAGCGCYGLESSSRGASEIIFNDSDKSACEVIRRNAKSINCGAQVLNLDFKVALEKLKNRKFDLVFLDPPYKSDFAVQSLDIIRRYGMLAENGITVIETENELDLPSADTRKYGHTRVYFLFKNSLINI